MPKGIYKKTENHIRHWVESRKNNGWFKSSKELKRKISEATKNRYLRGENFGFKKGNKYGVGKITNGAFKKGHLVSEITKEKIRQSNLNRKNKLGYYFAEETKIKISKTQREKWDKIGRKPHRPKHSYWEYENWTKKIFEYDNYTCWICEDKNGNGKTIYLEAHHLWSFAKYPELRYKISNGVALCKECHKIYG